MIAQKYLHCHEVFYTVQSGGAQPRLEPNLPQQRFMQSPVAKQYREARLNLHLPHGSDLLPFVFLLVLHHWQKWTGAKGDRQYQQQTDPSAERHVKLHVIHITVCLSAGGHYLARLQIHTRQHLRQLMRFDAVSDFLPLHCACSNAAPR